ncbi:MAG: ribosomal protection-like ABC-F family protein [Candidatus Merdivicinus sp.]|jgi:macrolide transport system ATP-binding/permease protein
MSKILLSASHIAKFYGDRQILAFEQLHVREGDKIGIVGANGAGKTTLLGILSGEISPDEGTITREVPVTYFRQFRERAAAVDPQAARQLGLAGKLERENLSGGEATRLGLAEMKPDALLTFADEPTANLDAEGIELCVERLQACPTLLLVSHDRSVLDRLCNRIIEVRDGKLFFYRGNYTAFRTQREQTLERQKFEFAQYQSEKARLEAAIREKGQASRSVRKAPKRMGNSEARLHKREAVESSEKLDNAKKSLISRLEHLEVKEKPHETAPVKIDFGLTDPPANRDIVTGNRLSFRYGDHVIFENAAFCLPKGSKTALIGPNGSGKTTLMELIATDAPGIRIVPKARIGYFRQNLSLIDLNKTALENVMETAVQTEKTMRGILARLLIRRDDVYKKAGVLSGGERVKLAFAKLFGSPANLLLLDEPTNFLDMPAIEALQQMICEYEGTVLFVSHDRNFSDACATRILRIEQKKLTAFDGNLSAWEAQQAKPRKNPQQMDKALLELRLAEVISRLSAPNCPDKEQLEAEFQQLLLKKKEME